MHEPIIYVLSCDAKFFEFAQGTIRSIRQAGVIARDDRIGFLNTGCTKEQLDWLGREVELIHEVQWECDFPGRDRSPNYLMGLFARPYLRRYFPGFSVYVWVDADAWVQDGEALELFVQGARRRRGLAIVPEVDRGQLMLQYGGMPEFRAFMANVYRETFGPEIAQDLSTYPMLNAGVFALHRDAPHWDAWREGLENALQRSANLYTDQFVLNEIVYRRLFEWTELLPAWCNWACHHGLPSWDRSRKRLVEPYLPHQSIGIVHLTHRPKPEVAEVRTIDGDTVRVSMHFPASEISADQPTNHGVDRADWDYVSPNLMRVEMEAYFPNRIVGNKNVCEWRYLRREVPHRWYVDKRFPSIGFLNSDEMHVLYNLALQFRGKPALEIGCWMGWSACALALAGVQLDVIDPVLADARFRNSVHDSLRAAGVAERVNLLAERSPEAVRRLAESAGRRWSLVFIDGDHETPGPLSDAKVCEPYLAPDCLVVFHDLASPAVAEGLRHYQDRGWQTLVYRTMQIMGIAWRGRVEPILHLPDPEVDWVMPEHLREFAVSGGGLASKSAKRSETAPGNALGQSEQLLYPGKPIEAEAAARQAILSCPSSANSHHQLGLALFRQGRWAEAETAIREAIVLDPWNADTWNDLAGSLEQQRRAPEAIAAVERALALRPRFALAEQNLKRLRSLPGVEPRSAIEENNLGVKLLAEGRPIEAETVFRRAHRLAPDLPELSFNIAKALQAQNRPAHAEKHLRRAIDLRPDWIDAYGHLGFLLFSLGKLSDAEAVYLEAVRRQPDYAEGWNALGANICNNAGRIDEARDHYRRSMALAPDDALGHSNMILNEQYAAAVSLARMAELHAEWDRRFGNPPLEADPSPRHRPLVGRPLRIGFVSGDFFYHPVGVFLAPILERLDRKEWYTVCYSNHDRSDELTIRLRTAACLWRNIRPMNDEAAAKQIRDDGIDLLVDLSGHTGRNRLGLFARRPAPVQLTWMGYVGSTGLSAIDYLIADRFHVPAESERFYREKILRLPDGYLCYEPPPYAPAVGPLPAFLAGFVTFGSFNNTAKITPRVVLVWSEILSRVPKSRLVLKYHWLDDACVRRRFADLFRQERIEPDRIEMLGSTNHREQLEQYNRIDLALDPFPYSGGLTTCEASWMGVPVVTCPGETFASRHSLSYLSNIGMTDTIVATLDEYVARAVRLASNLDELAKMRMELRPQMATSTVCDFDRYVRNFSVEMQRITLDRLGSP